MSQKSIRLTTPMTVEPAPKPVPEPARAAPPPELVMVFPRSNLGEMGRKLAEYGGFLSWKNARKHAEFFWKSDFFYKERSEAERDETCLQVIPYVVLFRGREVLRYRRSPRGTEDRLHGLLSIGVGGHVNPPDGDVLSRSYEKAMKRELCEEVGLDSPLVDTDFADTVAGFLYDTSNPVGRVHFGVVHFVHVPRSVPLTFRDPALVDGEWVHQAELDNDIDRYENWSRLVIQRLLC